MYLTFTLFIFLLITNSSSNLDKSLINHTQSGSNNTKALLKDIRENNSAVSAKNNLTNTSAAISNSNSSNITKVNTTLLEHGKPSSVERTTDFGIFTILSLTGIALFLFRIFQKDENYAKSLSQTQYKIKPNKNPFVGLTPQDIDTIASNNSRNLSTLSATYGILLSFIIAVKIDVVFQSWAFYVWTGLLVSTIIRSLIISSRLSDLSYISGIKYEEKIAYLLYSKRFLKHSAFVFLLIIAFIPTFTLFNSENKIEGKYPYLGEYVIVASALSVISVTLFFIYVSSIERPQDLRFFYMSVIFALIFTALLPGSPLDPIKVKFFSDSLQSIVPIITLGILFIGSMFSIIMISLEGNYLYFLWRRKRSK